MEAGRLPGLGAVCGCKRVSPEMGTATAQEVEDKWWMTLPNDPGRLLPKDGGLGQGMLQELLGYCKADQRRYARPFRA